MTVPDSGSDTHRLVSAAQSSLEDFDELHDYRRMFARAAFGGVQAGCAIALAIDRLATAVWAVVSTEEKHP